MRNTSLMFGLGMLGALNVAHAEIPVGYDIIELEALERVAAQDGSPNPQISIGYGLNNNNIAVGTSSGKFEYNITREVNGITVVETVEQDLLQAVDYSNIFRELTPNDQQLGLGIEGRGIFATTVTDGDVIGGYGYSTVPNTFYDVSDNCAAIIDSEYEVRKAIQVNPDNELFIFEPNVIDGQPLGSETEYLDTLLIGSNDNYFVGFINIISEKDECGNYNPDSSLTSRGLIYNIADQTFEIISTIDTSDQSDRARSFIEGINNQNNFVGWGDKINDDEQAITVGIKGTVGEQGLTEIPGLEGSTAVILSDLDNDDLFYVGASNKTGAANFFTAFYYDVMLGETVEIGYLNGQFQNSRAYAINNDKIVVGTSQASSRPTAFDPFVIDIDSASPQLFNLNDLIDCDAGWNLNEARDINENGVIVGTGTTLIADSEGVEKGEVRAFMLVPRDTPAKRDCEPSGLTDDSSGIHWIWAMLLLSGLIRKRHTL